MGKPVSCQHMPCSTSKCYRVQLVLVQHMQHVHIMSEELYQDAALGVYQLQVWHYST
jgi:hypothetical protein